MDKLIDKMAGIIDKENRNSFALPSYDIAKKILALPEIKDGLTLIELLQDNKMGDFVRWLEGNKGALSLDEPLA